MARPPSVPEIGDFYSRIAFPYDYFAGSVIFDGIRREAVSMLDLRPDATVLDIGCGTGGNIPFIAEQLGPEGTYVGLDAAEGMLRRAAQRETASDAHLLQGDARDPPVEGGFDAILVTFVTGVLDDPAAAVKQWLSLLGPEGRLVLLDAAGRPDSSTPVDWGFRAFVRLAAPPGTRNRFDQSPHGMLIERVDGAHDALRREATVEAAATRWRGFVRLTAASRD